MLNRYKVKIIKTWDFELDGKDKLDVERQCMFIMNQTKILDLPDVKRKLRFKIKRIERNKEYEENN